MSEIVVLQRDDLEAMLREVAESAAIRVAAMFADKAALRPLHVNQSQAAEMLNLSVSTISRMVKAGNIRLNKCGMIPIDQLEECVK